MCDIGWEDCNGNPNDGCETDLTSLSSCAACHAICGGGQVCAPNGCAATCPSGTESCSGSCKDTDTDAQHCGLCSFSCPSGNAVGLEQQPSLVCSAGSCGAAVCASSGTDPKSCGPSCVNCTAAFSLSASGFACSNAQCFALCPPTWGNGSGSCLTTPAPYTTAIILADHLNTPDDIYVDASNVYWTDPGDQSVWQVSVNGGSKTSLATGQAGAANLWVDDSYVYWTAASAINRVLIGGGTVEPLETGLSSLQGMSVAGGPSTSGSLYWVAGGTFYSAPKTGGAGTPIGTPNLAIAGPGRLSGLLFSDLYHLWSPTGVVSAGAGFFVLGRDGQYLRAGGTYIGLSSSIGALPGEIDINGSFYFSGAGIANYTGGMHPLAVAATAAPRHLMTGPGGVYWTGARQVLKAITCN